MTKRQLRKAAYTAIFKEGKTHDETFETLRSSGGAEVPPSEVAKIIATIPSQALYQKKKALWMTYAALMGIFIILRALYIILMLNVMQSSLNPAFFLIAVLVGIAVPAWAIYSVFTGRFQSLNAVGALLILGFVRGLRNGVEINIEFGIATAIVLALVVLSFLIPYLFKVPYTKSVEEVEVNGVMKKRLSVRFSETSKSDELLDGSI